MMDTVAAGATDVNQRIAARARELRASRRLTLDALAERTGVSRSMISLIERGESSPTAALLERLAAGLNVPLARCSKRRPLAFSRSRGAQISNSGATRRRATGGATYRLPVSLRRRASPRSSFRPVPG